MNNQIRNKDKKLSLEIIRFLITGVVSAIVDFLLCFIFNSLLKNVITLEPLLVGIYTLIGFIGGVTTNYLLSSFWVFKNVEDKSKEKTFKFILLFVLLSAVGWIISFFTMYGCTVLFVSTLKIDINDFDLLSIFNIKTWVSAKFWLFVLAFFLKTLFGMIWNYLTRKFILYKAPRRDNYEQE
jgi:putative flippase GtrA